MNRRFVLVLALLAPGAAAAQLPQQLPPFRVLDTDRNGALCRLEVANVPLLRDEFDRFDRNHNGLIEPAAGERNWIALDKDGDGRIAPSEFRLLASK